jgi:hypothetical protein
MMTGMGQRQVDFAQRTRRRHADHARRFAQARVDAGKAGDRVAQHRQHRIKRQRQHRGQKPERGE